MGSPRKLPPSSSSSVIGEMRTGIAPRCHRSVVVVIVMRTRRDADVPPRRVVSNVGKTQQGEFLLSLLTKHDGEGFLPVGCCIISRK